jgi:hypothetical protein
MFLVDRRQSNKHRAIPRNHAVWVPDLRSASLRLSGTTLETEERPYASPAVSNIAASIASVVLLPAHTTNWNAGK